MISYLNESSSMLKTSDISGDARPSQPGTYRHGGMKPHGTSSSCRRPGYNRRPHPAADRRAGRSLSRHAHLSEQVMRAKRPDPIRPRRCAISPHTDPDKYPPREPSFQGLGGSRKTARICHCPRGRTVTPAPDYVISIPPSFSRSPSRVGLPLVLNSRENKFFTLGPTPRQLRFVRIDLHTGPDTGKYGTYALPIATRKLILPPRPRLHPFEHSLGGDTRALNFFQTRTRSDLPLRSKQINRSLVFRSPIFRWVSAFPQRSSPLSYEVDGETQGYFCANAGTRIRRSHAFQTSVGATRWTAIEVIPRPQRTPIAQALGGRHTFWGG